MAQGMVKAMGSGSILHVHLAQEKDFVLARQRAKQIAKLLGFEVQDQTRIATAVSEIARNAYEYAKEGRIEFLLDQDGGGAAYESGPQMRVVVTDKGPGIPHLEAIWGGGYKSETGMGLGLIGARRLMDALDVTTGVEGTVVTLIKRLPRGARPVTMAEIATSLAVGRVDEGDVLHDQNQELLTLLGELRMRETELQALNAELEETNRGVLVLYAELEDKAQAVQQASEMKTQFLSRVTHELRTPLNSIVSLARLMLSYTDGPLNSEQEKQVQFMLRSAQNLTEMVNDLLDLAKIEAGKSATNLSTFTVAELYAGLRGMFRPLAMNPKVKLLFEIPKGTLNLWSDEGKLAQILRNFISNALKFTEEGTVTVTATPIEGKMIRFSVADTGVGIAPEHHEVVMQEWGQVLGEPKTRSKARGSGLGLPLSRSLAELLGGQIDFVSELGVGSTFHVTLPALAEDAEPEVNASAADGETPASVLIVDDDEVARYLLRRRLSSLTTAEIEEATSAAQALEALGRRRPELVFLDYAMPEMTGAELVRKLRDSPEWKLLPIVMYTSKVLVTEERLELESLEVAVISKRAVDASAIEEQKVQMERALLQVGLSNMHMDGPL